MRLWEDHVTEASRYHTVRPAPEERKVLFIHRRYDDSIANILKTKQHGNGGTVR